MEKMLCTKCCNYPISVKKEDVDKPTLAHRANDDQFQKYNFVRNR